MSTTNEMFDEEYLDSVTNDLKAWPSIYWGDNEQVLSVSPFLTFYFLYDTSRWKETSLAMIDIHEEFERMTGHPYAIATHPTSERPHPYGSRRLPNLREFVGKSKKSEGFMFGVTSATNHCSSPANAGYFWRKKDYMNDRDDPRRRVYSSIQLYYRWSWWKENKDEWRTFVLKSIERLSPEIVYSGFAMATPLEFGSRSAVTVWERALASRFFGLDIDDPWAMSMMGHGIRPPTWAFLLSDISASKLTLSREQIKDFLRHPDIKIVEVSKGLWIELGKEPSLYPVEDGIPELPALLNKLIKPMRNNHMDLLGFSQWDGDPNERFNDVDSMRWLQRFDSNSDWPTVEQRHAAPPREDPDSHAISDELRAEAGSACPRTGTWQSFDANAVCRHFTYGDLMEFLDSKYGITVWRYVGN